MDTAPLIDQRVAERSRELALDREGRIAEDLPCRGCGYNLRGHAADARCPECSAPVSLSARSDLLRFSDPDWIERLAKGMRLVVFGQVAGAVLQVTAAAVGIAAATAGILAGTPFMTVAVLVGAGISVVVVVGVWLLTTPERARAGREAALSVRTLMRWCLTVQIASAPLQMASPPGGVGFAGSGTPTGAAFIALTTAGTALWLVVLVGYGAGFVYLGRLALRAPKPSLARQTRIVMWGYLSSQGLAALLGMLFLFVLVPLIGTGGARPPGGAIVVLTAGGCAVLVGSLVFGIWALVLLFRYAALLKNAASAARAAWHGQGA